MSSFVISFRSPLNNRPDSAEEAEWGKWFGEIASYVADSGHRVGRVSGLGSSMGHGDTLAGYVVVDAEDFDVAVEIARGCPGLRRGRGVEVGETIAAS